MSAAARMGEKGGKEGGLGRGDPTWYGDHVGGCSFAPCLAEIIDRISQPNHRIPSPRLLSWHLPAFRPSWLTNENGARMETEGWEKAAGQGGGAQLSG